MHVLNRPSGAHLPTPPALPPALQRWADAKAGRPINKSRKNSNLNRQAKQEEAFKSTFPSSEKRINFRRQLRDRGGRIRFRPNNNNNSS